MTNKDDQTLDLAVRLARIEEQLAAIYETLSNSVLTNMSVLDERVRQLEIQQQHFKTTIAIASAFAGIIGAGIIKFFFK